MVFNQTNDIFHTKHNIKRSLAMYTCGLGEKTCCYFLMYEVLLHTTKEMSLYKSIFVILSFDTLRVWSFPIKQSY